MFKFLMLSIVLVSCSFTSNAYAKDFVTHYPNVINAMRTYNQDIISTDLSHPVPEEIIEQDKVKLIHTIDSISVDNNSVIKAKVDLVSTLKNFDNKIIHMKPVWQSMAGLVNSYELSN